MPVTPADDGFYHPSNEAELIELINLARNNHYELRVKGSGHSVPHAIYVDGFDYRAAEQYAPSDVANNYKANFQPVPIPEGTIPVLLENLLIERWSLVPFEARCR